MKSCCNSCKQGKPCCGSDMAPAALNGIFRKGIGYGAYTLGDGAAPTAPATVAPAPTTVVVVTAPPGQAKKMFGLDPKMVYYILGGLVIYKILF